MILASGTLAVGSNFRRFKEETGLLAEGRVREHIAPSPFDYQRNCLLYLPPITPSQADSDYYDDLAEQIVKLLTQLTATPWGYLPPTRPYPLCVNG